MEHSCVQIQISPDSLPSIPSWFGDNSLSAYHGAHFYGNGLSSFQKLLRIVHQRITRQHPLFFCTPCHPFPCTQFFLRSVAGRDSREYYDGSVPFLLAQGRVSRILTYSTYLARFRCPFASFNGIISHRFPERAFHWPHPCQCISHRCKNRILCDVHALESTSFLRRDVERMASTCLG